MTIPNSPISRFFYCIARVKSMCSWSVSILTTVQCRCQSMNWSIKLLTSSWEQDTQLWTCKCNLFDYQLQKAFIFSCWPGLNFRIWSSAMRSAFSDWNCEDLVLRPYTCSDSYLLGTPEISNLVLLIGLKTASLKSDLFLTRQFSPHIIQRWKLLTNGDNRNRADKN